MDLNETRFCKALRAADSEAGKPVFVASTNTVDRYGDIIDQRTWKLDNYRANPRVLVDHQYTTEGNVANGLVELVDGALHLTIDKWSKRARAQEVKQDVDDGIIAAVSVGCRPGRCIQRTQLADDDPYKGLSGYVLYDCELLEVSLCAVPVNPQALRLNSLTDEVIDRLASDPRLLALLRDASPAPERAGLSHLFGKK